jgi:hypothetical protein
MGSFIVSCTTDASLSVGIARAKKGEVTPLLEKIAANIYFNRRRATHDRKAGPPEVGLPGTEPPPQARIIEVIRVMVLLSLW